MRWILPILLVACLCQGCFVLEEIDKGQAILDQHSPKARESKAGSEQASGGARSARAGEKQDGGILADLQEWWRTASEPAPAERDPDDIVVRCQIDGRTHFTRKSDCRIRGGRAI